MNIKNITNARLHIIMIMGSLIVPTEQALAGVKDFIKSNTYVGMEAGAISEMTKSTYSFSSDGGANAYPKNPLLYGVFVGHKLNDRFGFELAYETQNKKNRIVTLVGGDNIPATTVKIPTNEWIIYKTSTKTQHLQAALHIKLHEFAKKENANVWLQLGASYSQLQAKQTPVDDSDDGPMPEHLIQEYTRTFKQWKFIPMAKIGVHYNLTPKFGLRATAGWRQLSLLKPKSQEMPDANTQIKMKDGFNFGLGFYFNI